MKRLQRDRQRKTDDQKRSLKPSVQVNLKQSQWILWKKTYCTQAVFVQVNGSYFKLQSQYCISIDRVLMCHGVCVGFGKCILFKGFVRFWFFEEKRFKFLEAFNWNPFKNPVEYYLCHEYLNTRKHTYRSQALQNTVFWFKSALVDIFIWLNI